MEMVCKGLIGGANMRKSWWIFIAVLLMSIGVPAARADSIISVLVKGEATFCIYNFPGPPLYSCGSGSLIGSFKFDASTNSVIGPWSIYWPFETFSGDGSYVSVSGPNLAKDEFNFNDDFVFKDLQLVYFNCPVGNGGDFCTSHASLIPVRTPEPSSIILLGTGLLGLVPLRRKLFGRWFVAYIQERSRV
jgi:hypothetical protein